MGFFNNGCGPCNQVPYTNLHDLNLNWILCIVQKLDSGFEELSKTVAEQLAAMGEDIEEIQKWIAQFNQEEFVEYIKKTVDEYLKVGVYFGLTQDGYFVAYRPENWSDIKFGTTGLDIWPELQPEYGHLTLSY